MGKTRSVVSTSIGKLGSVVETRASTTRTTTKTNKPVKKVDHKSSAADKRIAKTLASNPIPMPELKALPVSTDCGDCREKFESVVVEIGILLKEFKSR